MDDPLLDPGEHARALQGLARLNRLGRAVGMIWPFIKNEIEAAGGKRLSILDVACGRGDLLRALQRRGKGCLECVGVDISEIALAQGRRVAPDDVRFERLDALADPLPGADIVMSSLFLHHLRDAECVTVLEKMARAAKRLLLVSDLERSRFSYWGVALASRLVTRSPIVHIDGALSVRAAFAPDELKTLGGEAGLDGVRVFRQFPCRLILIWRPEEK